MKPSTPKGLSWETMTDIAGLVKKSWCGGLVPYIHSIREIITTHPIGRARLKFISVYVFIPFNQQGQQANQRWNDHKDESLHFCYRQKYRSVEKRLRRWHFTSSLR
jgi:hypothetical protein